MTTMSSGSMRLVSAATVNQGATKSLDIVTTRYTPGDPANHQTWSNTVTANAGEGDPALMTRGLGDAMARVEEAWKVANILDVRQSGTLIVRVAAGSLGDWIGLRDRLNLQGLSHAGRNVRGLLRRQPVADAPGCRPQHPGRVPSSSPAACRHSRAVADRQ